MSIDYVVKPIIQNLRDVIGSGHFGLHEPEITDVEKNSISNSVESGFVSSIGKDIEQFEKELQFYTGARFAVAVVNGTAALQLALLANGITKDDEVLVPTLTFAATAHAVIHCNATPHFIDSHQKNLGLDSKKLSDYLTANTEQRNGKCYNKKTGRRIAALIPVHVFGVIDDIHDLLEIAENFNIKLIEDAAEGLGSWKRGVHAGLFGICGIVSFNGNKIITTGGGGAILCNDEKLASKIRHLSTTGKLAHPFFYEHDTPGFNFRMPNLNAALGRGQISRLKEILIRKKRLHTKYIQNFTKNNIVEMLTVEKPDDWNCWLNSLIVRPEYQCLKNEIIHSLCDNGLQCRPIWNLLHKQSHLSHFPKMETPNAENWFKCIINIPSGPSLMN